MGITKESKKTLHKLCLSQKALTGVRNIDANISGYTDAQKMKEAINLAIHNLNQLKQLI